MLETLKPAAPDKIIEILNLFRADPRETKLDLGVGVYKDAEGRTPVMRAVKAAEARLLAEQDSKAYVGILGDLGFVAALGELALGAAVPKDRLSGAQTPGGTGAIRQLFDGQHAVVPRHVPHLALEHRGRKGAEEGVRIVVHPVVREDGERGAAAHVAHRTREGCQQARVIEPAGHEADHGEATRRRHGARPSRCRRCHRCSISAVQT